MMTVLAWQMGLTTWYLYLLPRHQITKLNLKFKFHLSRSGDPHSA